MRVCACTQIRNVGTAPGGVTIDLRVTNQTEYRAWRETLNGIKRQDEGDGNVGYFGVINLLGPRIPSQRPLDKFWNEHFTFVQLRYDFINGGTGAQLTLGRVFLTFFDFDTGLSQIIGAEPAVEMMQMGPEAARLDLATATEIRQSADWNSQLTAEGQAIASGMVGSWTGVVNRASIYGIGEDNPVHPFDLTELQLARSVMVMFEQLSTFHVRYGINKCCTTGRNFLFGGCAPRRRLMNNPQALTYAQLPSACRF